MSYCIKSKDLSALVIARRLMLLGLKNIEITLGAKEDSFDIRDLWEKAHKRALKETTFGRIGFFYDESNQDAHDFCLSLKFLEYQPKNIKRALKSPCYTVVETQILKTMAELGWENSVEFRRIARKYMRTLKHAHIDTLILLEPLFADEKIQKILQHLASTSVRIITPLDFVEVAEENHKSVLVKINTFYPLEKTQKHAQRLLKKKIASSDIVVLA